MSFICMLTAPLFAFVGVLLYSVNLTVAFIVGVLLFISLVHEERQRQQMNA